MGAAKLFQTTPRILSGPGTLAELGSEAKRLGASRLLLVSDPGLVEAGLVERAKAVVEEAGLSVELFTDVSADPPYEIAEAAAAKAKEVQAELVVGLGGGSSIDVAKIAAVLATNPGPVSKYFGVELIPGPGLPTIMVPTTAGTGSEVTPIAILSDEGEQLKKGVVSSYLFPAVAILDPELTLSLPPQVTAATGMDALIHAVEAFTSVKATDMTDLLAMRAMELIFSNIRTAFANGADLAARERMLEGSMLAGMAFANAGVTAVHAFAYPIGAQFHIPHGVANSIMLVPVMRFNMLGNLEKFAVMAEIFGEPTEGLSLREAAEAAVDALYTLSRDLSIPEHLREFGVEEEHIPQLAEGVMKVTRLLANNPRVLTLADAERIYREAL